MIEIIGNIWDQKATVLCITTNGIIRNDGALVMGRGVAKQCVNRNPGINFQFGGLVKANGNHFQLTGLYDQFRELALFPVKVDWRKPAYLTLIEQSAARLSVCASNNQDSIFILPRPGCGNGGLLWEDVKPKIVNLLPDNVYVISKE